MTRPDCSQVKRRELKRGEPCGATWSGQRTGPSPMEFASTGIAKDFRQSPCGIVGPSYPSDAFSSTLWYLAHCSSSKSDNTGCF